MKKPMLSLLLLLLAATVLAQPGWKRIRDVSPLPLPGGYNRVVAGNDAIMGTTLDFTVPPNMVYVVSSIVTKSSVKTTPQGYRYVDDWFRFGSDPTWVLDIKQSVVSTYTPGVTNGDRSLDGGKTTVYPFWANWIIRGSQWNYRTKDIPPLNCTVCGNSKLWGGDIPDAKATEADLDAVGWNVSEAKSWNGRGISPLKSYQLINGYQFRYELLGGQSYASVKNIYGNPNFPCPTYEQGRAAANMAQEYKVFIDQLDEGTLGEQVNFDCDGYIGYIERLGERFPTRPRFGSYGQIGRRFTGTFNPDPSSARNPLHPNIRYYYQAPNPRLNPNGTWDPFYQPRYGGKSFHSLGMQKLINYYYGLIGDGDFLATKLHQMDIMLRQNPANKPIIFHMPFYESPGLAVFDGTWWRLNTSNPRGSVDQIGSAVVGLHVPECGAFDGFMRGGGAIYWDGIHNLTDSPNDIRTTGNPTHTRWNPAPGSPSQFPYTTTGAGRAYRPLTPAMAMQQGRDKAVRLLNWLGTADPSWEYVSYRMTYTAGPKLGQTRSLVAPADGAAVLLAANDYLPVVFRYWNAATKRQAFAVMSPYMQINEAATLRVPLTNGDSLTLPVYGQILTVAQSSVATDAAPVAVGPTPNPSPGTYPTTRTVYLRVLDDDPNNLTTNVPQQIDQFTARGGNAVSLGVTQTRYARNPAAWDAIVSYAISKGCKVYFHFNIGTAWRDFFSESDPLNVADATASFLTPSMLQRRSSDGGVASHNGWAAPSLHYLRGDTTTPGAYARRVKKEFIHAFLNRFQSQFNAGHIAGVSFGVSGTMEIKYMVNETQSVQWIGDYSSYELTQFRNWAAANYSTISAFNAAAGTSFASFAAIDFPRAASVYDLFSSGLGRMFARYRTWTIKTCHDVVRGWIKEKWPTVRVKGDYGQTVQGMGMFFGTKAWQYIGSSYEDLKENFAFVDAWDAQTLKYLTAFPNKGFHCEVDGSDMPGNQFPLGVQGTYAKCRAFFEAGGTGLSLFAGFPVSDPRWSQFMALLELLQAGGYIGTPTTPPAFKSTLNFPDVFGYDGSSINAAFYALPVSQRPARIVLDESGLVNVP